MPAGIGIDLLEIGRLERALERRPRLAERLFTDGELAYARSQHRPGRHLAARFAAKEAALKALGGGALPLREIEVTGGDHEAPRLRLHGRAAALAGQRGVELQVSLTHSRELAAAAVLAVRGGERSTAARTDRAATADYAAREMESLARARLRRDRDARGGRLGDRGAAVPSLELMETAGAAVAEAARSAARPGPARVVCGKGNNGGDGLVAARLLARHRVRGGGAAAVARRTSCRPTRRRTWSGSRAPPSRSAPARSRRRSRAPGCRGRDLRHRVLGSAARAGGRRDRGDQRLRRPVVAADIASGVDASTGEVEGGAVDADVTVSFHTAKLGHWIAPGKAHAGELRVAEIGIPAGAPAQPAGGVISDRRARRSPPRGRRTRPSSTPDRCWWSVAPGG